MAVAQATGRLIRKSAEVPRNFETPRAVLGVMPRLLVAARKRRILADIASRSHTTLLCRVRGGRMLGGALPRDAIKVVDIGWVERFAADFLKDR